MTDKTVAVIQARMGSTRFPGKMIAPFHGEPILGWVLQRLKRCQRLDQIVLATSALDRDQVLLDIADSHGVQTFTGDEQNVLSRFVGATAQTSADIVVRVCADNPLIAPEAVDQLIDFYQQHRPDYAYNHIPKGSCTHPDGFGAEILSAALLRKVSDATTRAEHVEHVTSYIWDHVDEYDIRCPTCPPTWQMHDNSSRFDVDHPDDLERLERMLPGIRFESSVEDILKMWQKNLTHEGEL